MTNNEVTCGSCFCSFNVKGAFAGKSVTCPECGEPVAVPTKGPRRRGDTGAPASAARQTRPRSATSAKSSARDMRPLLYAAGGGVIILCVAVIALYLIGTRGGGNVSPNPPGNTVAANTPPTGSPAQSVPPSLVAPSAPAPTTPTPAPGGGGPLASAAPAASQQAKPVVRSFGPAIELTVTELRSRLYELPDGQPVIVSGTVSLISATQKSVRTGRLSHSLRLFAPAPESFVNHIASQGLTLRFGDNGVLDGLCEEQQIVVSGSIRNTNEGKTVDAYAIVSRGERPQDSPEPHDKKAVGTLEAIPVPKGVEANTGLGRLTFSKEGIETAGSVPAGVIATVRDDLRFRKVVVTGPVGAAGLRQLSELSGMRTLSLENQSRSDTLDYAALADAPRLREIEIQGDRLTDANLAQLATLRCLAVIELKGSDTRPECDAGAIGDAGMRSLAELKSLRQLSLPKSRLGKPTKVTEAGLAALAQCPRLMFLDLWSDAITGKGLDVLAACPDLWILKLANCPVTVEGLQSLTVVKSLRTLDLSDTAVDSAIGTTLTELPLLADVNLKGTKVDDTIGERLAGHRTLLHLDLEKTAVTDRIVDALVANPPPLLSRLSLRDTRVTPAGLRKLSAIRTLQRLTVGMIDDGTHAHLRGAIPKLSIHVKPIRE